ncbi:class I glutamine amidotransferase-like protein [Polychytrium aggregatum]|uniref:class I glutamine amidotransferase-like protein n=1 Tax=Polychytrium aggregatum TaxID=110093 RepID=UPI0022FE2A56|nr:class I glutamine amidotransferase-like protein [Polychytrium aggregatum]KAI9209387.1 class I glutamine amidotransferase-like protein [Polychytrium aggregatum]
MGKKVLFIVGDFVEDYEAMVPRQICEVFDIQVDVVAPCKKPGETVASAVHDFEGFQTYTEKRGHNIAINADFHSIDTADYDGLYIPGGRAPEFLSLNPRVLAIVKEFSDSRKPIAAICHGGLVLAAAGVINAKKACFYPATMPMMTLAGCTAVDANETASNAVVDGHLVTAPAWPAHPAMMKEFLRLLGAHF